MDTNEARIKLAEAMGWTEIRMKYVEMDERSYPFGCPPADQYAGNVVDKRIKEQIPDPFNDANDDYAVLEWMRGICNRDGSSVLNNTGIWGLSAWTYSIGDYARAACIYLETA